MMTPILLIVFVFVIYIINNNQICHSYCNHYYSQSYAFAKEPYVRPEKYKWEYGPGYYSISNFGKK